MVDWDKKLPEKPKVEAVVSPTAKPSAQSILDACIVNDWDQDEHETIMIYGAAKIGKTMAYMQMIKDTVDNGGKVYIVNTDDGVVRTFKGYFKDLEERQKMKDAITFYYISDVNNIFAVIDDINAKVTAKDLLIIDLMSEISWEMPQAKFVEDSSNGDPVGYIIKAQKDKKMFGLLEGTKWQYVKKIESNIRKGLVIQPRCNIVGICTEKDIEIEKAMAKMEFHKYDVTGAKPGGSKELIYDFNTLVYLGKLPNGKRFFQILGDRGNDINASQKFEFEKDFYSAFKKIVER